MRSLPLNQERSYSRKSGGYSSSLAAFASSGDGGGLYGLDVSPLPYYRYFSPSPPSSVQYENGGAALPVPPSSSFFTPFGQENDLEHLLREQKERTFGAGVPHDGHHKEDEEESAFREERPSRAHSDVVPLVSSVSSRVVDPFLELTTTTTPFTGDTGAPGVVGILKKPMAAAVEDGASSTRLDGTTNPSGGSQMGYVSSTGDENSRGSMNLTSHLLSATRSLSPCPSSMWHSIRVSRGSGTSARDMQRSIPLSGGSSAFPQRRTRSTSAQRLARRRRDAQLHHQFYEDSFVEEFVLSAKEELQKEKEKQEEERRQKEAERRAALKKKREEEEASSVVALKKAREVLLAAAAAAAAHTTKQGSSPPPSGRATLSPQKASGAVGSSAHRHGSGYGSSATSSSSFGPGRGLSPSWKSPGARCGDEKERTTSQRGQGGTSSGTEAQDQREEGRRSRWNEKKEEEKKSRREDPAQNLWKSLESDPNPAMQAALKKVERLRTASPHCFRTPASRDGDTMEREAGYTTSGEVETQDTFSHPPARERVGKILQKEDAKRRRDEQREEDDRERDGRRGGAGGRRRGVVATPMPERGKDTSRGREREEEEEEDDTSRWVKGRRTTTRSTSKAGGAPVNTKWSRRREKNEDDDGETPPAVEEDKEALERLVDHILVQRLLGLSRSCSRVESGGLAPKKPPQEEEEEEERHGSEIQERRPAPLSSTARQGQEKRATSREGSTSLLLASSGGGGAVLVGGRRKRARPGPDPLSLASHGGRRPLPLMRSVTSTRKGDRAGDSRRRGRAEFSHPTRLADGVEMSSASPSRYRERSEVPDLSSDSRSSESRSSVSSTSSAPPPQHKNSVARVEEEMELAALPLRTPTVLLPRRRAIPPTTATTATTSSQRRRLPLTRREGEATPAYLRPPASSPAARNQSSSHPTAQRRRPQQKKGMQRERRNGGAAFSSSEEKEDEEEEEEEVAIEYSQEEENEEQDERTRKRRDAEILNGTYDFHSSSSRYSAAPRLRRRGGTEEEGLPLHTAISSSSRHPSRSISNARVIGAGGERWTRDGLHEVCRGGSSRAHEKFLSSAYAPPRMVETGPPTAEEEMFSTSASLSRARGRSEGGEGRGRGTVPSRRSSVSPRLQGGAAAAARDPMAVFFEEAFPSPSKFDELLQNAGGLTRTRRGGRRGNTGGTTLALPLTIARRI